MQLVYYSWIWNLYNTYWNMVVQEMLYSLIIVVKWLERCSFCRKEHFKSYFCWNGTGSYFCSNWRWRSNHKNRQWQGVLSLHHQEKIHCWELISGHCWKKEDAGKLMGRSFHGFLNSCMFLWECRQISLGSHIYSSLLNAWMCDLNKYICHFCSKDLLDVYFSSWDGHCFSWSKLN